jgi:hypothetical protein
MADLEVIASGGNFLDEIEVQTSPREFYQAVKDAVERRKIPGVKFATVEHKVGGIFSDKREYLRITWKDLVYDICGAPFGTGFFVSWWQQAPKDSGIFTGFFGETAVGVARALVKPDTFYKADTVSMFKGIVSNAFNEAVDKLKDGATQTPPAEVGAMPTNSSFYK